MSWIIYTQIITSFLTAVIMPILVVIITRHTNRSDRDRAELISLVQIATAKMDAHIIWHMGQSK